jgi:lysophospholipase L1-like esterase
VAAGVVLGSVLGTGSPAVAAPAGAVVVLGDSVASGDGAGDYLPGTRGEDGNWCHRSPLAYVNLTGLAREAVNLACSGARSADVAFAGSGHNTEASQARRLVAVARQHRVTTVLLQVGANDDGSLTPTGFACVRAFIDPAEPACRTTIGPQLPERTRATAAGVERAARDVRAAMGEAGYGGSDYTLVLLSYAPPVSGAMIGIPAASGCPYSRADATWGHDVLFPAYSEALRGVADRVGARFLDLARATDGFEACTRADPSTEWHRRITVDPRAFVYGGLDAFGYHLAQESFHPTAIAHTRIGGCVGELVRSGLSAAACVTTDGVTRLVDTAGIPNVA